ncbi:hypothetical protein AEGHOMDF_4480 [Methylobacterium soli]|nr:hypothetical protein AEGHOMDF_4480 [Methylobacterium soli]
MVALRASRFVCAAMPWIRATTSPIRVAASLRPEMMAPVSRACATALPEISEACVTCWLISETEAASSSAPEATVWMSEETCVEAWAACPAWREAPDAASAMSFSPRAMAAWVSARRRRSSTCAVTSVANLTTFTSRPSQSKIGL